MRLRIAGVLLFGGILGVAGYASTGAHVQPPKQWTIVNFTDPVTLRGHVLMGPYLVVHDEAKMARGEPCTSIYRFDTKKGPQQEELAFMCQPSQRTICEKTTISTDYDPALGLEKVTAYQFAGDSEVHGVPR